MAGVGKTSIARTVSATLSLNFVDTDLLILDQYQMNLEDLKFKLGDQEFIELESRFVFDHLKSGSILAPGGSFIYATNLIEKIRDNVVFIYLYDEPSNILKRIPNLNTRGIVGLEDKSFSEICLERHKLCLNVAHFQYNINHLGFSKTISQIKNLLIMMK